MCSSDLCSAGFREVAARGPDDGGGGRADELGEAGHRALALQQRPEDLDPGRVGQHAQRVRGAADVVLQPVGRCGVRVTLVGADGVLGDTMVDSLSQAEAVRDGISGLTGSDWTRELVSRTDVPAGHWKRMAGSGSLV